MKLSFNSLDITVSVKELQYLKGMRVNQIYDVDSKTYLIKLHRGEEKSVLLIESGVRFHATDYDWPKNPTPSGFTMKLRKHLQNRRIEHIERLGQDRIVDFQFGSGEAAYHLILELFNRGNIVLTDHSWLILSVLRPHTEGDRFKFAAREEYPISRARQLSGLPDLREIFNNAKSGDKYTKILLMHVDFGPSLLEHLMLSCGFGKDKKYTGNISEDELEEITRALLEGRRLLEELKEKLHPGFIIKSVERRDGQQDVITYNEFQPYLFKQHESVEYDELSSFNLAVDEYFSKLEINKIQIKALQQEKEALAKVKKVKEDQEHRVDNLVSKQAEDRQKAELIFANSELLDEVICAVRKAIAIQMPWPDINTFFADLNKQKHPIGLTIEKLKLEINHVSVSLSDPFNDDDDHTPRKVTVDLDLALSAHANATRYYSDSKSAAMKERKTIDAHDKAIKSAEKKAKLLVKDIQNSTTITIARKVFWFEKFFWFISSDNYLVIGGRDQQQNELIVKKYMKKGDIYVHADLHGASSIVIKNPSCEAIPPRTLNEAGCMAVCYSVGWEAKVICSAWWVHSYQVSKTAPTGEYLTTGSFMVRGTKNYLLPSQLAVGFGFMFKMEDSSASRHRDERKAKILESPLEQSGKDAANSEEETVEVEHDGSSSSSDEDVEIENKLDIASNDDVNSPDTEEIKVNLTSDVTLSATTFSADTVKENSSKSAIDEVSVASISLDERKAEVKNSNTVTSLDIDKSIIEDRIQNSIQLKQFPNEELFISDTLTNLSSEGTSLKLKCSTLNEETNFSSEIVDVKQEGRKKSSDKLSLIEEVSSSSESQAPQQGTPTKIPFKRGQKSKLKKIKGKYKDQDDEERKLRMSILKPDGAKKSSKKDKKLAKKGKAPAKFEKRQRVQDTIISCDADPLVDVEEIKDSTAAEDETFIPILDIIDQLTGQPLPEDELLFAVPVVAPYSALLNYKYKLKLTPGTGKRGKSARTALDYFLKLRDCNTQEKLLLKNVPDQTLSRNFPGKVKLNIVRPKK